MRTVNRLLLTGLIALTPMAAMAADTAPSGDPEVTIRTEGDKTIQEYRQNGFLYAIKVTQKGFPPYLWCARTEPMRTSSALTSRIC